VNNLAQRLRRVEAALAPPAAGRISWDAVVLGIPLTPEEAALAEADMAELFRSLPPEDAVEQEIDRLRARGNAERQGAP